MFLMVFLLKSSTLKFFVKLKFSSIGLPKRNGYGYVGATIQHLLHHAIKLALVKAEEILFPCNPLLCSKEITISVFTQLSYQLSLTWIWV